MISEVNLFGFLLLVNCRKSFEFSSKFDDSKSKTSFIVKQLKSQEMSVFW